MQRVGLLLSFLSCSLFFFFFFFFFRVSYSVLLQQYGVA